MPPLLGINASPIQAVEEILWAQNARKSMLATLKPYAEKIQLRLAEEFRIAEEIRIAEEQRIAEELRLKEEAKQAKIDEIERIKAEKLRLKEEAQQAKIDEKERKNTEK
jgi:hypothetical protein